MKQLILILLLCSLCFSKTAKYVKPEISSKNIVMDMPLDAWFSSGQTTVYDYAGSLTGAVTGTSIVPAYPGFDFAGNDEYIDTTSAFQAIFRGSFTISLWFKADDGRPSGVKYLIGANNAAHEDNITVRINSSGDLQFSYVSNSNLTSAISNTANLNNGQESWHYICCVADSTIGGVGGLKIYFDGTVVTLGTSDGDTSGITFADYTSADEVYIGANDNDGTAEYWFAGRIAEVKIFSSPKTAVEVKNIFEIERGMFGI